jgi:hypothetical protein
MEMWLSCFGNKLTSKKSTQSIVSYFTLQALTFVMQPIIVQASDDTLCPAIQTLPLLQ